MKTTNQMRKIKMMGHQSSSKRLKILRLILIIKRSLRQLTSSKREKVMPKRMIQKKRRLRMLLKRRRTRRKRNERHFVGIMLMTLHNVS